MARGWHGKSLFLSNRMCCKGGQAGCYACACMRRNRPALFRGRHFEAEIIVLCVRWYLRFGLSFRNLEELMGERKVSVDHVTIWRWVQRYAPDLHRRCRSELRMTNRSWRVDETYLKIAGSGPTYIGRSIPAATRSIFCFLLSAFCF